MRNSIYKEARLNIFEKHESGAINTEERDKLFAALESQKNATELTSEKIKDFFDELSEKYPEQAEDIDKLAKKLNKAEDAGEGDGEAKGDDKGSEGETSGGEEEVNESVKELLEMIEKL